MTTTINGGRRLRLIKSGVQSYVETHLDQLGWFDAPDVDHGGDPSNPGIRRHRQVTFYRKPAVWDVPVELNAVMVHKGDLTESDLELGSDATEDSHVFYCDVYAEKDSIGEHIAGDVRDILKGRFPSIGCNFATIPIRDIGQATPPVFTTLNLESITVDRSMHAPHAWQQHWYAVQFVLLDTYDDVTEGEFT